MKKLLILLGILVPSVLLGYFFLSKKETKSHIFDNKVIFVDSLRELSDIWKYGNFEGDKNCKSFQNVANSFYQCNKEYFNCLLDKKKIKLLIKKKRYLVSKEAEPVKVVGPTYQGYHFRLSIAGKSLPITLQDGCSEVYLPERIYQTFALDRDVVVEWDNFNKSIFVDKYLVRVKDVKKWVKDNKLSSLIKDKADYEIVTNFLPKQMEKFCHDHGKKVLSSKVFDAMSMHPDNISNPKVKNARTPYYPWSRKNTKTKLFFIQKEREKVAGDLLKSLCKKVYSEECVKSEPRIHQAGESATWMGAFETLGGPMEYVSNIINPSENIRVSSIYYPLSSHAHRVGARGFWNGEGHEVKNFVIKKYPLNTKLERLEVAFRCMRLR